ncbi:hypothetical protein [Cryobacterium sp. Y11]|uniref:hypothetical protein n=1 Tax=Cryobacterium sp. Y11 TaxID=2045016 RepID=UPI000CE2DD9E|nr:hypothetical protein [Cryobacterium sp. Y11]
MTLPALLRRRAIPSGPAALVDHAPADSHNLTDVGGTTYFLVYGRDALFCFDGSSLATVPHAPVGITRMVAVGPDLYLTAESDRHPGLTSIHRYRNGRFTFIATTEASQLLLTSFRGRAYFRLQSGLWYINGRHLVPVAGSPRDILALTVFGRALYVVHHDFAVCAISTYSGSSFTRLHGVPAEGPSGFAALDDALYIRTHRQVYVWARSTFSLVSSERFTGLVAYNGVLYAKAYGTNKLGVLGHTGFSELANTPPLAGEIYIARGALYFLDRAGRLHTHRTATPPLRASTGLSHA